MIASVKEVRLTTASVARRTTPAVATAASTRRRARAPAAAVPSTSTSSRGRRLTTPSLVSGIWAETSFSIELKARGKEWVCDLTKEGRKGVPNGPM